jgi:CBS domain-containing protein
LTASAWYTQAQEAIVAERLTTGEICTREVAFALRAMPLVEAAQIMRETHVGCLVVVDEVGTRRIVVGVLTDRDVVVSVVAPGLDPAALTVGDVMSAEPVTARENDSLIDLMRLMRARGVRRVPVTQADGELIGIATLDDVLAILAEELGLLVAAIDRESQRERKLRS